MSVISRANALHSLVRPSSICLPTNGKICIKTPFCLFLLETFSWNHHSVTSHTTLLLIAGIWTELPVKYIEKQLWRYCQAWGPGRILLSHTKTDLTRESTAVLHPTLSILLWICMLGFMAYCTDTKFNSVQYQVKSSFEYLENIHHL